MSEKRNQTSDAQSEYMKYLYEGSEFLLANQLQEAREVLEKAMEIDPNDAKGLSLLGLIYYRLGEYDKAERIYVRLVQRFPKEASLRVNLGLVLMMRQKPKEAVVHMNEAVRVQPDHQRAHIYLGHLYTELGDAESARREFLLAGQEHMADKVGGREGSEPGEQKTDYVAHDMDVTPRPQIDTENDKERGKQPVSPGMLGKESRVAMHPSSGRTPDPGFATPPPPPPPPVAEEEPVEQEKTVTEDRGEDIAVSELKTPPPPPVVEEEPVEQEKTVAEEEPVEQEKMAAEEEPVEQEKMAAEGEPVEQEKMVAEGEPVEQEKMVAEEEPVEQEKMVAVERESVIRETVEQEEHEEHKDLEVSKEATKGLSSDDVERIKGVEPFFSFAADRVLDTAGVEKEDLRVDKDGMLVAGVRDEIFIREAGLVAYSRNLKYAPALMRSKGRNLETTMEDEGLGRMFRVEGNGLVLSAPGSEGRFVVLELFDDFLYLKREAVFAFSSSLYWENGNIRSSEFEMPLIHLRGEGRLAMWISGEILKARIEPDHPVAIQGHYLLGWMGNVVPKVVIPGPNEPMAGIPVLECKGEGVLLLKP